MPKKKIHANKRVEKTTRVTRRQKYHVTHVPRKNSMCIKEFEKRSWLHQITPPQTSNGPALTLQESK